MARIEDNNQGQEDSNDLVVQAESGGSVSVPDSAFVTGSQIIRDGQDLKLESPDGQTVTIENYFSVDPAPIINSPEGQSLTPDLVQSFAQHQQTYAQAGTMTDESPVGSITEIEGSATITHTNGTTEIAAIGTPVYEGDIIETNGEGSLNISFIDDTQFAISSNARLAIDEYVFDASTESGSSDFSVLRGLFVFTSGLIGRDDPDDVEIDTPMGSIGIRGTMIAGNVDTGEITVLEGAIVLRGVNGGEVTLAQQFETARFNPSGGTVDYVGTTSADNFSSDFNAIKTVSPYTFIAVEPTIESAPEGNSGAEDTQQTEEAPAKEPAQQQKLEPAQQEQNQEKSSLKPTGEQTVAGDTKVIADTTNTDLVFQQKNDAGFDATLNPDGITTSETTQVLGTKTISGATRADTGPALTLSTATQEDPLPPPPAHLETLAHQFYVNNISSQIGTLNAGGSSLVIAAFKAVVLNTSFNKYDFRFVFENPDDTVYEIVRTSEFTLEVRLRAGQTLTDDVYEIRVGAALDGNQFIGFDFNIFNPVAAATDYIDLGALMSAGTTSEGRFVSGSSGERLGDGVAAAGDINSDGRPDVLVSNSIGGGSGATYIYSHNGSNLGTETTGSPGTNLTASALGDIDGDGFADYVLGSPDSNSPATNGGFAEIISSNATIIISGQVAGDHLGSAVAGIGDVNGDGLNDVLIGAEGTDNSGADDGSAYVIYGRTTNAMPLDITAMSAGDGYEITGSSANGFFGSDASAAGDMNNDGFADFAVSAYGNGEVTVFYGGMTGPIGQTTISGFSVDMGATNPSIPLVYLGDVDGDGIGDMMAASTAGAGTAYIFSGASLAAAGSTTTVSSAIASIAPDAGYELIGGGSAGDFNGDGLTDVALAIRNGDQADVFVIDGEALADGMTMSDLLNSSTATRLHFDLNDAGLANPSTDNFTFEITSAGDVNGDGFDDLIIGTPDANSGNGGYFTVYGSPEEDDLSGGNPDMHATDYNGPANLVASSNGDALNGSSGVNVLSNLNGSAFEEISFIAGAGDDVINLHGDNARHIDGGAGSDTLNIFGAGTNIDFGAEGNEFISNIEHIAMNNAGQSITLGIDDIFSLMQESQAYESLDVSRKILKISDISGGTTTLNIDDNGTSFTLGAADTTFNDGTTYNAYYFEGGYALLIDQNIDVVTVV